MSPGWLGRHYCREFCVGRFGAKEKLFMRWSRPIKKISSFPELHRFLNYNKCWMRTVAAIPHARVAGSIAHCAQNVRFFGCSSLSLQA